VALSLIANDAPMTNAQFWLILIFIGVGFWGTIVLLEALRKDLKAHRDLMDANAQDQLFVLRQIGRELVDSRYTISRHAKSDALEETRTEIDALARPSSNS
jgi:hypothetical protein